MSKLFLCYDLKGIQSFIFTIPKLKYICGGSAIIDLFDKETVRKDIHVPGCAWLFSGGGKGAFRCDSEETADSLKIELLRCACEVGLTISFGIHAEYTEAAHFAGETYPWVPTAENMRGKPCEISGLYPSLHGKVNEMVRKRIFNRGDKLFRRFEEQLLDQLELPFYFGVPERWQFMHDVDAKNGHKDADQASKALGGRNRWAVITMDGNDMGTQHRIASERHSNDADRMVAWIKAMSNALDTCSREACRAAIKRVLVEWAGSEHGAAYLEEAKKEGQTISLPVRPLVVGGDDIIVLCHASYAMTFVKEASRVFSEMSMSLAEAETTLELWPASKGRLTITAGVLYAPVSLPLASAIAYTESLMASAKNRGRKDGTVPSPACIDWESVTEGVIDTPAERRQRDLIFIDGDTERRMELTKRPYTLDEFSEIERLMKTYSTIPSTIRHQIPAAMRAGKSDRLLYLARLGKRSGALINHLSEITEEKMNKSRWCIDQENGTKKQCTDVIDALLLMEEDIRMTRNTTEDA